jgi:hypothetical protein
MSVFSVARDPPTLVRTLAVLFCSRHCAGVRTEMESRKTLLDAHVDVYSGRCCGAPSAPPARPGARLPGKSWHSFASPRVRAKIACLAIGADDLDARGRSPLCHQWIRPSPGGGAGGRSPGFICPGSQPSVSRSHGHGQGNLPSGQRANNDDKGNRQDQNDQPSWQKVSVYRQPMPSSSSMAFFRRERSCISAGNPSMISMGFPSNALLDLG